MARWEKHLRVLVVLERECLDLSEGIEQVSEKQELLATPMESKKCLQKDGAEIFQERILQELEGAGGAEVKRGIGAVGTQAQVGKIEEGKVWEPSGAEGGFVVATDCSSFCSCSPCGV